MSDQPTERMIRSLHAKVEKINDDNAAFWQEQALVERVNANPTLTEDQRSAILAHAPLTIRAEIAQKRKDADARDVGNNILGKRKESGVQAVAAADDRAAVFFQKVTDTLERHHKRSKTWAVNEIAKELDVKPSTGWAYMKRQEKK